VLLIDTMRKGLVIFVEMELLKGTVISVVFLFSVLWVLLEDFTTFISKKLPPFNTLFGVRIIVSHFVKSVSFLKVLIF